MPRRTHRDASVLRREVIKRYSGDGAPLSARAQNLKDFRGFETMIPQVVQNSVGSVLGRVAASRHVLHAALINEDANGALHINQAGGAEIDQLSLLASSKYLFMASDLVLESVSGVFFLI